MTEDIYIENISVRNTVKVGDFYKIKDDTFYYKKSMMVVKILDSGVVFEDQNEPVNNRLVTRVQYCFGWPPMEYYLSNKIMQRIL